MKLIKILIVAMAIAIPSVAFALNDDEEMEFITALGDGDAKIVQKYLDNGVDIENKSFAWAPLQIAANKGQLDIVKLLVEHGANVNYQHPITKMTALALAAYNGSKDIVLYLLSKNANPNIKLRGDVSIVRAVRDTGNTEMVELLMKNGALDDGCEGKCN